MPRDYAYEALAEVTSTDMNVGRGALNAGLRDIRAQSEVRDSFQLAREIRDRAGLYRELMPDVVLTPTALAKHWKRVKEASPRKVGTNLAAERYRPSPPSRREQNLAEARKLMKTMGWA